ncbi:hypothetical protein HY837_01610 [archaeon]|nr:hypothetical protein [archaeon]
MKLYQKIALSIAPFVLTSPVVAQEVEKETRLTHEYRHALNMTLSDNLLTHQEVVELHKILEDGLQEEMNEDYYEKQKLRNDAIEEVVKSETKTLASKITELNESKKIIQKLIDQYPGLIDDKAKIVYSSEQKLKEFQEEMLKQAISSLDSVEARQLLTEEDLYVQDLVFISNRNTEESSIKEEELKDLEKKIRFDLAKSTEPGLSELAKQLKLLNDYFDSRKKIEESSVNKKYYSVGILPLLFINNSRDKSQYEENKKLLKISLEHSLKMEQINFASFEEEFPNYPKATLKLFFLAIASIIGPALLHGLIKAYRKDTQTSEYEVAFHLVNVFGTTLGLDFLHPWIFPAKFVAPLIYEISKGTEKK